MPYLDGLRFVVQSKTLSPYQKTSRLYALGALWSELYRLRRDDLELKLARDILVQLDRARPSPNVLEVGRGDVLLLDAHARALLKQLRDL